MRAIFIFVFITFYGCSFDNKSGIWKNEQTVSDKNFDELKNFETLSEKENKFNKNLPININFEFPRFKLVENKNWRDKFYQENNNLDNFRYKNENKLYYKTKKISKHRTKNYLLSENGNIIVHDNKGNLIIYSITQNNIVKKFNFYKKRYKKVDKNLNLIVEKNIIYVSDNLGYLYAFDYKKDKVLWAKNYKIPFRSNLKLSEKKLYAANQNNFLYIFDKLTGKILRLIPSEETLIKNNFRNNLSQNTNSLFFLNTYGSLYSIEKKNMRINWFINLNQSMDLNPSNLFIGSKVVNFKNKLIVSNKDYTYILNSTNGSIIYKLNFSLGVSPVIIENYTFLITKNNFLICFDLQKGNIVYSYNLDEKIAEFLDTKKKNALFSHIFIINNQLNIFLKNSYLLKLDLKGSLKEIKKLPSKIQSDPIVMKGSIIYLDNKKKINFIN